MWTIDGVVLHTLRFFKGIGDGEPMFAAPPGDERRPRFRIAMTTTEVARVTPKNLRPATFGTASGFRFEMNYFTRDGVHREALVAGAVFDRRLHVIVYDGTSLYHVGKYRADAERVIDSVKLKSGRAPKRIDFETIAPGHRHDRIQMTWVKSGSRSSS